MNGKLSLNTGLKQGLSDGIRYPVLVLFWDGIG